MIGLGPALSVVGVLATLVLVGIVLLIAVSVVEEEAGEGDGLVGQRVVPRLRFLQHSLAQLGQYCYMR